MSKNKKAKPQFVLKSKIKFISSLSAKSLKIFFASSKHKNKISDRQMNDRLIMLSSLCLLLAFFTALSARPYRGEAIDPAVAKSDIKVDQKQYSFIPILEEGASFPVLSAQAVVAMDLASGVMLYEKSSDHPLLPASTTKILSALVAMDQFYPESVLRVDGISVAGQKANFYQGEEILASELMKALLVYSANDAAEVFAYNYPGGRQSFIQAMNNKSKQLMLLNSQFANPSGLDQSGNVTTARDLLRLSREAMKKDWFTQLVREKEVEVFTVQGRLVGKFTNTNKLLGEVDGVLGVKTGWTENARENLVTYLQRDDAKVMIVVLGSQDRFGETQELIDWIFEKYTWQSVVYSP